MIDVHVVSGNARLRHVDLNRSSRIETSDGPKNNGRLERNAAHGEPTTRSRDSRPREHAMRHAAMAETEFGPLHEQGCTVGSEGMGIQHVPENGATGVPVTG